MQTPTNKLKSLYKGFKKPKTTVIILLILLVLYFLGLVIPQKVFFKTRAEYDAWMEGFPYLYRFLDFMGFTEIYVAPLTVFFLLLFFLNLIVVTSGRIPLILKKAYLIGDATPSFASSELRRLKNVRSIEVSSGKGIEFAKVVSEYFRKKRWFVSVNPKSGSVLSVKNRLSVLGFLMFHLSFFVLLAGGLLIFYSRFSGSVTLTEGQWFKGDIKQFHKVHRQPKMLFELPSLNFYLKKVTMIYDKGQPADLAVSLRAILDGETSDHTIGINRPIKLGSLTMLSNNVGVSPLMILRHASDGKEIDGAWVSLNVLKGGTDHFLFDKTPDLTYHARFFSDYVVREGIETSRSPEIKNPAFNLRVMRKDKTIANGTIKPGQAMVFESYMLEFADFRRWAEFQVVREMGPAPLIVGFSLAIMGLVMRLIFYRREIRIAVQDSTMYITGTAQLNEHAFKEEMDGIVEELRGVLC